MHALRADFVPRVCLGVSGCMLPAVIRSEPVETLQQELRHVWMGRRKNSHMQSVRLGRSCQRSA
eukprot:6081593-Lingulodinium_polyedra.AAC.1